MIRSRALPSFLMSSVLSVFLASACGVPPEEDSGDASGEALSEDETEVSDLALRDKKKDKKVDLTWRLREDRDWNRDGDGDVDDDSRHITNVVDKKCRDRGDTQKVHAYFPVQVQQCSGTYINENGFPVSCPTVGPCPIGCSWITVTISVLYENLAVCRPR